MYRNLAIVALVGLLLPSAALAKKQAPESDRGNQERELKFHKGTMQLGGTATLDIQSANSDTNFFINLDPTFGYFVTKKVEVFGTVGIVLVDGDVSWNLGAGGKYYFDMKPMWAYLGAQGSYGSVSVSSGTATSSLDSYTLYGLGGILYPLGKNVALDAGARVGIIKFTDFDTSTIDLQLGYLGVQAFFR
jgi:hypothetical protein